LQGVIENTSIENGKIQRQKQLQQMGKPFFDQVCYRTGKINSWEESLTAETLQLYDKYYKISQ